MAIIRGQLGREGHSDLRNRIARHEPLLALDIAHEYHGISSLAELVEPRLGW
ncbi:hypothetical protein [Promicromonospora sp. NPDC023805]|uniref:hypothetical protein n=1 Tax=Promicromonospora sp. NPDC023805 TaxID=3154696 RepID=UPI0033F70E91